MDPLRMDNSSSMENDLFATVCRLAQMTAVVMAVILAVAAPGLAADSSFHTTADAVRESLDRLHEWLGEGRNGKAWRKYLKSDQLLAQLEQGPDADRAQVRKILSIYERPTSGLELTRFVSVRNALDTWYRQLQAVPRDQLPDVIRAAKGKFQPLPDGAWEKKRALVRRRAAALERYIERGGEQYSRAWKTYLHWDILMQQLQKEDPELAELNSVLRQLYSYQHGLELPIYRNLRESLHDFMNATVVEKTPNMAAKYDEELEKLAVAVESYNREPSVAHATSIGRGVGWLQSAGQAAELQEQIRLQYAQNNLYATVSSRFAALGVNDTVDETLPIRDCILGTSLRGTAHTLGVTRLALIPNPNQAEFEIQLNATAHSDNIGVNRGVTVYSTGQTTIDARKRILFDAEGIQDRPSSAECCTNTQINDICHKLRLVEKIAWKQAGKQKPRAEQLASQRAEQRVAAQMDERAAELLVDPRRTYERSFRSPLLRRGEFPQQLKVSTSPDSIQLAVLQANVFQTAAPAAPPELSSDFDLALRLHESFVSNFSEAMIANFTLTDERLVEILEEANREIPDELKIEPNKDPWSITFADNQPIWVSFDDQKVRIVIRGKRFTRGDQRVSAEMEISATYTLTRTEQGAKLIREGEVEAAYTAGGFENPARIAVKTLMRKKFGALFKEEFIGEGLQLEGRWGAQGPLRLGQLDADSGWIVVGWSVGPNPANTAQVHTPNTQVVD